MSKMSALQSRLAHLRQRMLHQKDFGDNCMKTELRRCLSLPQLTLLGIGNTIGVGIYVMLGVMAKENAGPSVVLSFVAAIFVTMMNALVYAEFATIVPQTGACYIYIYKVFGEFIAFLVGWVMLITGVLATSVGARAWSGMVDSFFNHTVQEKTMEIFGKIQFGMPFAESLDLVALVFQIGVIIIISCNVFCSSIINTILGIMTSLVLVFVFAAGLIYGDVKNFTNSDHGGFFPFGIAGVIKGASLAMYATSGFEIVSMSAEEAKDPAKSVPRAIILELIIVGIVYLGAAIGMLYLIPYWLINLRAPLPSAFEYNGLIWGKAIVTFGPLFGITNLQMLGMYGVSRVIYRMAKDGLFFQCFLKVNKRTGVPLNSVVFVGVITSLSSLLLDLSYIVQQTVILMLLNYMIVGSALIKLKITEFSRIKGALKTENHVSSESLHKDFHNFYNHEVVVSDYETCESADSPEAEAIAPEDRAPADSDILIDFSHDQGNDNVPGVSKYVPKNSEVNKEKVVQNSNSRSEDLSNSKIESTKVQGISGEIQSKYKNHNEHKNHDKDEDDSDDQQTLFQKTLNLSSSKKISSELSSADKQDKGPSSASTVNDVLKERIALFFAPFVPGVISVNTLLTFHWITCVAITFQVNFGWQDLAVMNPVAILSISILLILLLVFSLFLWALCGPKTSTGFQTPLMPLVPTMSILSSSALLLSAGELAGILEVIVLVLTGAMIYIGMVLVSYESDTVPHHGEDTEQRKALVGGSGDDADDEVDSEDEL